MRGFPLDLSDSKSVDILAPECPETDLLVNNAGAIPRGNIAKMDEARLGSEGLRLCQYDPALLCLDGGAQERVIINIIGAVGESVQSKYITGSSGKPP